MRNISIEALRDILFYALRQVLRDMGHDVSTMRKGYDVVYYQVGNAYSTFSLFRESKLYTVRHTVQSYDGDYTMKDFGYVLHEDEQQITDLMNCLRYVITSRVHKGLTCSYCKARANCPFADDPYNTDGDCLASK